VKQNGLALRFISEQTPEICVAAVKQNSEALKYVKKITSEKVLREGADAHLMHI
jgi:hypothetical protein